MAVNGNPSKKQRRRSGIIYSTVLNRTPLPALAFTQTSPWDLASFLFSPLIGQVFRRECRIGGASEFTPSSTVVLQSKSCADPLPSLPPLRFHPPLLPSSAIVHFARAKNRLSRPFLYFQRSQTTRVDHRGSMNVTTTALETIGFNFARPGETELAGLSVRKLCFPHGRSIFALPRITLAHVSLRSTLEIPCISLPIRDTR